MKKITAFFLLLLPIFITGLMFISGLIININFPVSVVGISMDQSDQTLLWTDPEKAPDEQVQFSAHVLPLNAKNKGIRWESSDTKIVDVNENGKIIPHQYGKVMITAIALGNESCRVSRELDVYDYVVHSASVTNKYDIEYLAKGSVAKPIIQTLPSIDHADKVDAIEYSLKDASDKVTVDKNTGIINVALDADTTKNYTLITRIKTSTSRNENRSEDFNVETEFSIGDALDYMSWDKDNTDETTDQVEINLYDKLTFGPASKDKITSKDFIYQIEGDSEEVEESKKIAKVDENGKVTFNPSRQNEYVTFVVTYRRNTNLRLTKKIKFSNNKIEQVFFSQPSVTIPYGAAETKVGDQYYIPFDKPSDHPEYALSWLAYPELKPGTSLSNVKITSTNDDVVSVEDPNSDQPKLRINNGGKCALIISASDETNSANSFTDVCDVNILTRDTTDSSAKSYLKDQVDVTSAYYVLRDNMRVAKTSTDPETIKFEIEQESVDNAYIDDNSILHFKNFESCSAKIRVYVGQDTIGQTFTINYTATTRQPIDLQETINVKVGEQVELNGFKAVIDGKYYQKNFDSLEDGSVFIPTHGCDIPDFEVISTDGSSTTKKIRVIVEEKPIYISTLKDPCLITKNEQVDFLNEYEPSVYPSSATRADGSSYNEPIFEYTFLPNDCGKYDENVITFSNVGTCIAHVNFGTVTSNDEEEQLEAYYLIRCTFNDEIGKFKVTRNDSLFPGRGTAVHQFDNWNWDEDVCVSVPYSYKDQITITSHKGLCNPTTDWTGTRLLGSLVVKKNPIPGKYGTDVIEISSPTFSFFLNVSVNDTITDFVVTCEQDTWTSSPALTYTKNLNVRVTPNTIGKEVEDTWGWSLNDETKPFKWGLEKSQTIDLNTATNWNVGSETSVGQNVLYLFDGAGKVIKAYQITHKGTTPKFGLYNSEDGIFTTCNSDRKSALVVFDGYVEQSNYDKFELTFTKKSSETCELNTTKNIINVSGMPNPEDGTYENTFTLTYDNKVSKTYNIGRDTVSKIKLDGFNILDQSDRRGMQKVHVYGNYTLENGNEVNYIKVPVKLWDSKKAEIPSGQKKLKALKNLKITVGRNSAAEIVDADNGDYIRVHLDSHDLYSTKEIYNDAFDTLEGKNVDFQVATKSNEIHADYRFVGVEGTNVKTQDGFIKQNNRQIKNNTLVLQTNFGLSETASADNAILNSDQICDLLSIYGNGYSFNFQYVTKKAVERDMFQSSTFNAFNIDICGADSQTLTSRKNKILLYLGGDNPDRGYADDRYFAYCSMHNFTDGITTTATDKSCYFKNCIIHNQLNGCFYINSFDQNHKPSIYLENCSFFNSASIPILAVGPCPIKMKGDIRVYNFQDKEMLRHVGGLVDLTSLWPVLLGFARSNHMTHIDFKGEEVINSFMVTALDPLTYFWDYSKNEYVQTTRGIQGSAKYLAKYADISISLPIIGRVGADMWGGTNPAYEDKAPSYSDEFDNEGKLRISCLNEQFKRLTRTPVYF